MARYSQLYIERGKPEQDGSRFRNRLAAFISHQWSGGHFVLPVKAIIAAIETKLGCSVPRAWSPSANLAKFFEQAEIRDILDTVTLVIATLGNPRSHDVSASMWREHAGLWRRHVEQVFGEENLAYRLGQDGIVHPFIDPEFEANRAAALAALSASKFGEARSDFDEAFRHLRNGEGKQAVRMMFPAVETAAKVLFPNALARLMPNDLDKHLLAKIEAKYAGNQPALDVGRRLLESFKQWIIASQPYRHGQEVLEPADPPQDLVVAYMSAGATFLRWMIELSE